MRVAVMACSSREEDAGALVDTRYDGAVVVVEEGDYGCRCGCVG
jgi:hypothetical protein